MCTQADRRAWFVLQGGVGAHRGACACPSLGKASARNFSLPQPLPASAVVARPLSTAVEATGLTKGRDLFDVNLLVCLFGGSATAQVLQCA